MCAGGKELKCYSGAWTETGNPCTERSEAESAQFGVNDSLAPIAAGAQRVEVVCYGNGGPPKPDVFTQNVGVPIQAIAGRGSDIIGRVTISGEGTNFVVIEVWPAALGQYQGKAWCTVII